MFTASGTVATGGWFVCITRRLAKSVARDFFSPLATATEAARRQFDEDELHVVVRFLEAQNDQLTQLRDRERTP